MKRRKLYFIKQNGKPLELECGNEFWYYEDAVEVASEYGASVGWVLVKTGE